MTREQMQVDVLVVGAGPAGLSAAIHLKQLKPELSVCVLEKGAEVGAHILSGAIFDPIALQELMPDSWQQAPLGESVKQDHLLKLSPTSSLNVPHLLVPKALHNKDCHILSLGKLCRWLAEQAQSLGVDIFPGFAASEILYDDTDQVIGVITGDMGRDKQGELKPGGMLGMEIIAQHTIVAEGCRGHLGKELIERYQLNTGFDPQHYALGFKEVWQVTDEVYQAGKAEHTFGWPLLYTQDKVNGGGFIYHGENNQVYLGLIVDLNYQNPHLDPFEEFQQFKRHPHIQELLKGAERISYGARTIAKGGWHALPQMQFAGGLLIGCDAGTLDGARIKGSHTAMKSGILAAELIAEHWGSPIALSAFGELVKRSWLGKDLYKHRNAVANLHKFGALVGGALNWVEQTLLGGKHSWHVHDKNQDHSQLKTADECPAIDYPKPDKVTTFNRTASLFLANLNHDHDQPCHLQLKDDAIPIQVNLPKFAEPAQRYCPAGVYEVIDVEGEQRFQINAQNCLHCKCCDIKEPQQNINWVTPEGGSGPQYGEM
ncbi:electron transfer flavoprotein-ubiquinone oxidoreductase [Corallincola platygyrae]|uniref:Electron transfer flavoprotein-ubiquinone oxidoreductase n=1 Tax=Corallincola platygyrae TaxID=1193278 RepID=A0ABW4XK46_9GAMM